MVTNSPPYMLLHITDLHLFVFSGGLHLVNPMFSILSLYPPVYPGWEWAEGTL